MLFEVKLDCTRILSLGCRLVLMAVGVALGFVSHFELNSFEYVDLVAGKNNKTNKRSTDFQLNAVLTPKTSG